MKSAATITRRSVLGLGALALAACKKGSRAAPPVDPDSALLESARTAESALLDAATDPADRAAHRDHLLALGGPMGAVAPSPVASPQRKALRSSADDLRRAAISAVDGRHAALFASIAASHEVLAGE